MVNIEKFLLKVERPAQYLGNEFNSFYKENYDFHMCLIYPDLYEVGMSNIGIQLLYSLLNQQEGVFLERAFAPQLDMEEILRKNKLDLFSLETKTSLKDFDMLGFSLSYEMTYTNVFNMLDLARIPLENKDRKEDDPIISAGGTGAFNPKVLEDFVDVFIVGDGEEVLVEISNLMKLNKEKTRDEKLKLLSEIEGLYVPKYYNGQVIKKRIIKDLDIIDYDFKQVVPYSKIVHNRGVNEIQRGCTRGCRFCQAGIIYRPIRERSLKKNLEIIKKNLVSTGYNEISLSSLSSSDYSCISELIDGMMNEYKDENLAIALPSLRMDKFSVDIAKKIEEGKKTGFTFAPEAGSQRMRDVINKGVNEEDIIETAKEAVSSGWTNLKFYFMIGLPFETDEDIEAIYIISKKVLEICIKISKRIEITVSVSNFVPKSHTPYQWQKQIGMEEMIRKHDILKSLFRKEKKMKVKIHEKRISYLEGVLSRGDKRIGQVVKRAWELGAKFDGWRDHFKFDLWEEAMKELEVSPEEYLRERELAEELPWDIINIGVNKSYYLSELNKSKEEALTKDCRDGCINCGLQDVCTELEKIKK